MVNSPSSDGPHSAQQRTRPAIEEVVAIIDVRDLHKRYGHGPNAVHALRGVDLQIEAGEFASIMGPSGSGKSTLLNMIGMLDAPTAGEVYISGKPIHKMSAKGRTTGRRKALGFVFQAFHLMPRTSALENVMLPMIFGGVPRNERRYRAERLLAEVDLADRMHHVPSELSGGQKQRVAIARALAMDPPILLADEPTGNLDSETSAEIMQLFKELNEEGKTVIQVTHDPNMAKHGARTIRFIDGLVSQDMSILSEEGVQFR